MARFIPSRLGLSFLVAVAALLAAYSSAAWFLLLPPIVLPPAVSLDDQPAARCRKLGERRRGDGAILFVPLAAIPGHLVVSLLEQEDHAFYAHNGVNWVSLWRASIRNIGSGRYRFGAGTLTMQLMRELELGKRRTLLRKTREIAYALQAEKRLTKAEILELYLNVVHWGPEVRGVGAASCYYFGVPPGGLSENQSRQLVAVLQSPPRLGPQLRRRSSQRRGGASSAP